MSFSDPSFARRYYRPLFRGFDPAFAVGRRRLAVVGDVKTRAFENNGCRRKNPLRFAAAFRARNGLGIAKIPFQLELVSTTGTFIFVNGQGLRPPVNRIVISIYYSLAAMLLIGDTGEGTPGSPYIDTIV